MKHRDYEIIDPAGMFVRPAEDQATPEWVGNHSVEARRKIGAWRWPLLHKHREALLSMIKGGRVIDFGGAAGPLGYGAIVVDRVGPEDGYRSLYEVEGPVDTVFTCHTLEHVEDLGCVLVSIREKLIPGGHLIVMVPHWTDVKLRAENWPHHCHTFCVAEETAAPQEYTRLDTALRGAGLDVLKYAGEEGHLLVLARRPS
jgi:SAM-dependent methyltransferase